MWPGALSGSRSFATRRSAASREGVDLQRLIYRDTQESDRFVWIMGSYIGRPEVRAELRRVLCQKAQHDLVVRPGVV